MNHSNNMDDVNTETKRSYRYRFANAEFDEARFELRVSGLPVEVERRALEVLRYLLRHAGEVVTKEELLREVWAGRITVEKVLPNAVNKLRRALGESNAQFIVTQARLGYRLDGVVQRTAVGTHTLGELKLQLGQTVPGRENFLLRTALSHRSSTEVWLAEHSKTHERRVYKFALDGDALRALKREATLSRVLQESLDDTRHFVTIMDWNFEHEPYFLECEYAGQNLLEWAGKHLTDLPREPRIALFLQVADAVAAAHSVGVLHKDLKPANILIAPQAGDWLVRIADFGSGRMLDPDRLTQLGITKLGMTITQDMSADSSSGTPMYIAPEVFAGNTPTVQSDVFALGILLYQLLVGQLTRPMVSGWEQDVSDDFLCLDLGLATDGNPVRRFASVTEFAIRLRDRPLRQMRAEAERTKELASQIAQAALARNRARRPFLIATIAALVIGACSSLWLMNLAVNARNEADIELQRATAINRFLNEDLIGRSNPMVAAKGQNAILKDVLLAARDRINLRFVNQPSTEAFIRASLAGVFYAIEIWADAETEARSALSLFASQKALESNEALKLRLTLIRILSRAGKFEAATTELTALEKFSAVKGKNQRDYLTSAAWATYQIARSDFAEAARHYAIALPALKAFDPDNNTERDALRLEQIAALTAMDQYAQAQSVATTMINELLGRAQDTRLLVAMTQAAIARSYSYQGEHVKAIALLLAAQSVIVERLGPEHGRNLTLLNELMSIYFRQENWPKALSYAEQIHVRIRAKVGIKHNMTYVSLANWGRILLESGNAAQAQSHLRKAYVFLAENLGTKAPQTQDAAFILAHVEIELGHWDAAAAIIQILDVKVLEAFRGHGLWRFGLDGLRGLVLDGQGQRAAAEPLLRSAVAGLTPEAEKDRPDRLMQNLTKALTSYPSEAQAR